MAKESIEDALKRFDERYYKLRLDKVILDSFGNNLLSYMKQINFAVKNNETEEHIKNIVNRFLKATFYSDPKFEINAYKRVDSAIMYNNILYAILEMKKPANKTEMVMEDDINRKALWEIVYYYLCETRDVSGKKIKINYDSEIRRLIITDSRTWVLINAQDLDKLCEGYIEKLFYKFRNNQLPYKDVNIFYGALSEYFLQIDITEKLRYVYFEIDKMCSKKSNWQYLFKIFKRDYLLKDGYKQIAKTHVLNGKFYQELLYLMGLKEVKADKKNVIIIDPSVKGSLANQVYSILTEEKERPEEALSNAVYHRAYNEREPIEVRVENDRIEIVSFPGPDRSVTMEGLKSYRVSNRRYRNRRIGDFLKELHLTEGRNTGFKKILDALEANGSPKPEFETDEDRSYFISRLFVHEAFAKDFDNNITKSTSNSTPSTPNSTPFEVDIELGRLELRDRILILIKNNSTITKKQMSNILGVSMYALKKELAAMSAEHIAEFVGFSRNGKWVVYQTG